MTFSLKVWDLTSPSEDPVLRLVGHAGTVRCLQLIGNRLVSGSTDTTIKVEMFLFINKFLFDSLLKSIIK